MLRGGLKKESRGFKAGLNKPVDFGYEACAEHGHGPPDSQRPDTLAEAISFRRFCIPERVPLDVQSPFDELSFISGLYLQ